MEFLVQVNGKDIALVAGMEAAWEAYFKAKALAEEVLTDCALVDFSTGETIAWWDFATDEGF